MAAAASVQSIPLYMKALDVLLTTTVRSSVIMAQAANVLFAGKLFINGANFIGKYSPISVKPLFTNELLAAEKTRREAEGRGENFDVNTLNKEVEKASLLVRLYFKLPSGARDMFWGLNKISTMQLAKWMLVSVPLSNLAWSGTNLILGEPHPKINQILGVLGPLKLAEPYSNPLFAPLCTWLRQKAGY